MVMFKNEEEQCLQMAGELSVLTCCRRQHIEVQVYANKCGVFCIFTAWVFDDKSDYPEI